MSLPFSTAIVEMMMDPNLLTSEISKLSIRLKKMCKKSMPGAVYDICLFYQHPLTLVSPDVLVCRFVIGLTAIFPMLVAVAACRVTDAAVHTKRAEHNVEPLAPSMQSVESEEDLNQEATQKEDSDRQISGLRGGHIYFIVTLFLNLPTLLVFTTQRMRSCLLIFNGLPR